MPRYRRPARSQRPDLHELDTDHEWQLLTGNLMLSSARPFDPETFAAAWEIHRARLLPKFIEEHPGTRPFAWWYLEHKKERPIVRRSSPDYEAALRSRTTPCGCLNGAAAPFGFLHTSIYGGPDFAPFQEEEHSYLARHGLLTTAEQAALKRKNSC